MLCLKVLTFSTEKALFLFCRDLVTRQKPMAKIGEIVAGYRGPGHVM